MTSKKTTTEMIADGLKPLEKTAGGKSAGPEGNREDYPWIPPEAWFPPDEALRSADRGLRLRMYNEDIRGIRRPGGTQIGIARALQLLSGKPITPRAAKRIKAYFDRHQGDRKASGWGDVNEPSPGFVAWELWGGDSAWEWATWLVGAMKQEGFVANETPWVDKALHQWGVQQHVPQGLQPVPMYPSYKEYGGGAYGAVLPTDTTGIVIKVTSDATEPRIAQHLINLRNPYTGIVRFDAIRPMGVQTFSSNVYKTPVSTQVWALWREEAFHVGSWHRQGDPGAQTLSDFRRFAWNYMGSLGVMPLDFNIEPLDPNAAKEGAKQFPGAWDELGGITGDVGFYLHTLRSRHGLQANDDGDAAARYLATYYWFTRRLQKIPNVKCIGDALEGLFWQGVLLCDLHSGNVGIVSRGKKGIPVIVDVGRTVFLPHAPERTS
jgi:hypothetical protein